MLEITKTIVTKEGDYVTENASYKVMYEVAENKLRSLNARVITKEMQEGADGTMYEEEREIGQIYYQEGVVNVYGFPYSVNFEKYVHDFTTLISEICE